MKYNFAKYLGIPYKDMGRDFTGVDCYGLIHLIFKTERNIVLPDYTENMPLRDWPKTKSAHILYSIANLWKLVKDEEPKVFDVHSFLDEDKIIGHVGINIGQNSFLHVLENRSVVIGKVDVWAKKLVFTMRYVGNA